MTDRTTINVPQDTHKEAREVKEEFNDSWPDVLAFYARHRPTVSVGDGSSVDVDGIIDGIVHEMEMGGTPESEINELVGELETEIKKAQELAEQAKNNTEDIKRGMGR